MHSWKKLGHVFNPAHHANRAWLKEFAQAPATLLLDDRLRVYFSCRPPADECGQYRSYSAYVDFDRSDLGRVLEVSADPILALGGRGEFDEFGTYPVSVVSHDQEILAYYAGWTRCESVPFDVAIGMARSSDGGTTFRKEGRGPILSYSPDEPFILSGPKIRKFNGKFHLFYIAGRKWVLDQGKAEPVYKIRSAVSSDGVNWIKTGLDLIPSKVSDDEAQASPDVFYRNGRYHMFFCYRHATQYRGHERGYRIGYASSSDLINWTRDDDKVGIDVSKSGWDSEMISYPHVFELDGDIYMYYLGNQVGRHGFGLAKLEGDL